MHVKTDHQFLTVAVIESNKQESLLVYYIPATLTLISPERMNFSCSSVFGASDVGDTDIVQGMRVSGLAVVDVVSEQVSSWGDGKIKAQLISTSHSAQLHIIARLIAMTK